MLHSDFGVIIEARMNSSRLPGKVLYDFGGIKSLELMIRRIGLVFPVNSILVATTESVNDDALVKFLQKNSINVFRGSEHDVMDRVLKAAKQLDKNYIVSLTGDCPLIDSRIIESMIRRFNSAGLEYMSNFSPPSYPDGMEVQIFSNGCLEKIENLSRSDHECEHVGLVVRNNSDFFRSENYFAPEAETWPNLGLTLDEEADAILIRQVLDYFYPKLDFSCASIIKFLKKNPDLTFLNSNVERRYS